MARTPPKALSTYLRRYDRPIRSLTLKTRAFVIGALAPCNEYVFDAGYTVALGYGPTARVSDAIVYIGAYRHHVNIGFWDGASLADPAGLLKGDGKRMRHITIASPADLARPELPDYLRRARLEADPPMLPHDARGKVISIDMGRARKKKP
jgi:hypothetical protein